MFTSLTFNWYEKSSIINSSECRHCVSHRHSFENHAAHPTLASYTFNADFIHKENEHWYPWSRAKSSFFAVSESLAVIYRFEIFHRVDYLLSLSKIEVAFESNEFLILCSFLGKQSNSLCNIDINQCINSLNSRSWSFYFLME